VHQLTLNRLTSTSMAYYQASIGRIAAATRTHYGDGRDFGTFARHAQNGM